MHTNHVNLFIAYTPYHVLLLTGKALVDCPNQENYFFIFSDFERADDVYGCLKKWNGVPFKEIFLVKGSAGEDRMSPWEARRVRYWDRWKQGNDLVRFIRRKKVKRVYLCNDERVQSQYVLHEIGKQKDMTCDFFEDGSYIYQSHVTKTKLGYSSYISKLIFGAWWQDVTLLALNKNIRDVYVSYPEIVRKELRHLDIKKLKAEFLLGLSDTPFIKEYFKMYKLDDFQQIEALFIVPHSEFFARHPQYQPVKERLVDFISKSGIRLGLKYHPREPNGDYWGLAKKNNCALLPSTFPIEVFYMGARNSMKIILGDVSTALFTAKWLMPEIPVISLSRLIDSRDKDFISSAEHIGLAVPQNMESLQQILQTTFSKTSRVETKNLSA